MHFAVIAAGEGTRLIEDGIDLPKPLIPLSGQPMIGRLLEIMMHNRAECVCVIVNSRMTVVQQYLREWHDSHPNVDLRVLVESTPSSMHSLAALTRLLPDGKFVCTTVDTVFREKDFANYVTAFERQSFGTFLFGVTPFVDDEKPLWVDADSQCVITRFADEGPAPYVSGGIYGMDKQTVVSILDQCLSQGKSRMRNFQRALLESGVRVGAFVFEKVMDIDHRSDIDHAEEWLAQS